MTRENQRITPVQVDLLVGRDAPGESPVGPHLDGEQLLAYAEGALASDAVARLDLHLGSCRRCATGLAWLVGATEAWRGEAGERRFADIRARAREAGVLRAVDAPHADHADHGDQPRGRTADRRVPHRRVVPRRLIGTVKAPARSSWQTLFPSHPPDARISALRPSAFARGITAAPSSQTFGDQPAQGGADGRSAACVGPPSFHAFTALYSRNARVLPDIAEVFWAHEIWLIAMPCRIVVQERLDVELIGLSVRVPREDVEVIEALPHTGPLRDVVPSPDGASHAVADLRWNGRAIDPLPTCPLESTAIVLGDGATLQLARDVDVLGRLTFRPPTSRVLASMVGPGEAWFLFDTSGRVATSEGTVYLVAVTDKYAREMTLRMQVWIMARGLNEIPARLESEPATWSFGLERSSDT